MQIAAEHPEAVGQRSGSRVKERLLFDGIALHAAGVAEGHTQHAAAVEAHLADASRAVRDRTRVAARIAAQSSALDALDEFWRGVNRSFGEEVRQRRHQSILRLR